MTTLFQSQPAYTIDTSSFIALFKEQDRRYYRKHFISLWNKIEEMFNSGELISHLEVLDEIKLWNDQKDELIIWSKPNKDIFIPHDIPNESSFITFIGQTYPNFNSQGKSGPHADPWLIAQAHIQNLTVITEEDRQSPKRIPFVCNEMGVKCTDLFGLIAEKKWSF